MGRQTDRDGWGGGRPKGGKGLEAGRQGEGIGRTGGGWGGERHRGERTRWGGAAETERGVRPKEIRESEKEKTHLFFLLTRVIK